MPDHSSETPVTRWLLKIELEDAHIKIEREFIVPSNIKLSQLHKVIQIVMGWDEEHMHSFVINNTYYDVPDPMAAMFSMRMHRNERRYTLEEALPEKTRVFRYWYDFGDDWMHKITVRSRDYKKDPGWFVRCLSATGQCPFEDCGGVFGYADLCEQVNNPEHPEHEDACAWAGFEEVPKDWEFYFDLEFANKCLAKIDKKLRPADVPFPDGSFPKPRASRKKKENPEI